MNSVPWRARRGSLPTAWGALCYWSRFCHGFLGNLATSAQPGEGESGGLLVAVGDIQQPGLPVLSPTP